MNIISINPLSSIMTSLGLQYRFTQFSCQCGVYIIYIQFMYICAYPTP